MKEIATFAIDHTILPKGMYTSRIDGNCITYEIRMKLPNKEEVMTNGAIHTLEHLFATFVRNSSFSDEIIYFGPMGCRTGFNFITRDSVSKADVIKLTADAFSFCASFEGEIPGVSAKECGNYKEHDLETAKKEAEKMVKVLENWTEELLVYPTK